MYQRDDTLNVIDLLLVTALELKPTRNGFEAATAGLRCAKSGRTDDRESIR